MMNCIGCDAPLTEQTVAAYAIMHERDLEDLNVAPTILGAGKFHAGATCHECYVDPSHRTRQLKAHFGLPPDIQVMLGLAGSSTGIGG